MQTTAASNETLARFATLIDVNDELDHAAWMACGCPECLDLQINRRDPLALCRSHEESPTIYFTDPGLF